MQSQTSSIQRELNIKTTKAWWKKPLTWGGVVVLVGGGVSYWAIQNHNNTGSSTAMQIRWVSVQRGNVQQTVSLSGTLNPANQTTVTSTGKLLSLAVKVGDKVTKGQTIAQVDASGYETQLKQAQAQLTQAEARLAQSKEPVSGASTRGQATSQSPDPNVVAQSEAAVVQAQAQVDGVLQQIAACTITTPISGTVLQVTSGNQTTSSSGSAASGGNAGGGGSGGGNTIAIIADLTPSNYVVQATVAQSDATAIHSGQSATISLSANNGSRLNGKVESTGYLPQTQGGVTMYPVTIDVNAPASAVTLLPGESVSVTVSEKQADNVLTLPVAALTQRGGSAGVYVKSGDATATADTSSPSSGGTNTVPSNLIFEPVTVGLYGGNTVEIKGELSEGQQVAILLPSTSSQSTTKTTSVGGMMGGLGGGLGGFGGAQGGYGGRGGGSGGRGSGTGGSQKGGTSGGGTPSSGGGH